MLGAIIGSVIVGIVIGVIGTVAVSCAMANKEREDWE